MWAFGVGFYNLFLGCGMVVGVIAWMSGNETVGRTLVTYICLVMVLGGIVLFIADRLGFGGEREHRRRRSRACHRSSPLSRRGVTDSSLVRGHRYSRFGA